MTKFHSYLNVPNLSAKSAEQALLLSVGKFAATLRAQMLMSNLEVTDATSCSCPWHHPTASTVAHIFLSSHCLTVANQIIKEVTH